MNSDAELPASVASSITTTNPAVAPQSAPAQVQLPPIDPNSNKYTRGKLTLLAGSARFTGAAALAACAAERMGAGYTEVLTVPEAMPLVRAASPSLVVGSRENWQVQLLPPSSAKHPSALGIGPGFAGTKEERILLNDVLAHAQCPVLVDGGALGFLARKKALQALALRFSHGFATVATPHGGEAQRIAEGLGLSLDPNNPAQSARILASELQAIVVLKGPHTYISDGTEVVAMTQGTPALAKAGTGDVLAGIVSSLLAQGMDAFQAAVAGATIHARAGVCAAQSKTERCVIAGDVIDFIPNALADLTQE